MAITLTPAEKRELKARGMLIRVTLSQKKRRYWDEYGEEHILPGDAWSMEHYVNRGLLLRKPLKPKKRPKIELVGVEDWDGKKEAVEGSGPTATYYDQEGTPIPNLPADPASMREYLAAGLTLSPPRAEVKSDNAPVPLRAVRQRKQA